MQNQVARTKLVVGGKLRGRHSRLRFLVASQSDEPASRHMVDPPTSVAGIRLSDKKGKEHSGA